MKHLEQEIEALKPNPNESQNSKAKLGSYAMFNSKAVHGKMGNEVNIEMLWPEMGVFLRHLYEQGYFAKANFVSWNKGRLDFSYFDNSRSRGCIKIAVDKFAKDNQKIVKWLSASDVENVALFGCPSTESKSVFGAKRLRKCFDIPEQTVCKKCALRESCKFVNKDWKGSTKCSSLIFVENLDLADVMSTITLYALDSVPSQLIVPDEVKSSVSRLLKQILKLSQTIT